MANYKRKDSLVWGVILIVIGALFLLENIVTNIDVFDLIARLWPVVLIIWGAWKLYFGLQVRSESRKIREKNEN